MKKTKIGNLYFETNQIINDYRLAFRSRQASILGRKEVMIGRAKFGIFGDGKEVAQLAMAKVFRKGDFRSGYYRDQTFMLATGMLTIEQFFAQLYAHTDEKADPSSAGRGMSCHFGTRSLNQFGNWKNLVEMNNSSSDISPTGSQMPRLVGLGYASKMYREIEGLKQFKHFSKNGNEVAFGTIGNASCAEGIFWESINASGVLKIPIVLSIWDDNYGISVPNEYQITKRNLSELLKGFQFVKSLNSGLSIYTVQGWNFPKLIETYLKAEENARKNHIPAIIHVTELTQPQGHSTSGSHERYKTKKRLAWEKEFDYNQKLREWMISENIVTDEELDQIEDEDTEFVKKIKDKSWEYFSNQIFGEVNEVLQIIDKLSQESSNSDRIKPIRQTVANMRVPFRRAITKAIREILIVVKDENISSKQDLLVWKQKNEKNNTERFSTYLTSQSEENILSIKEVKPVYSDSYRLVNGFEVLNSCFDAMIKRDPRVIAFGEDVGKLGAVNQGFRGLQEKFGELRVTDTGIRECTIIGQAIGMALRGLRPLAEIQYVDYLLYAIQILSDDLATLQWRTKGGQKAPIMIRTRGHRLEGVWHSGSPMAGILNLLRGVNVFVPRNMTQAAGFYNTLLKSDEPGLVIEVLNGYRLKEKLPDNIDQFSVPAGVPEILRGGTDITIVTYGACCKIALDTAEVLKETNISVEVIDIQSLLPFDIHHIILDSMKKTNRVLFLDEDVPGGTTAYMMQKVIEEQSGFQWLDSPPRTLSAKPHRPSYGSDGDYFSKPNVETVFEVVYEIMHESNPNKYPIFF